MPKTKIVDFVIQTAQVAFAVGAVVLAVLLSNRILNYGHPFQGIDRWAAVSNTNSDEISPANGLLDGIEDVEDTDEAVASNEVVEVALPAPTPPPAISQQLQQGLPPEARALYVGIDPVVQRLQPQYQEIANAVGIPWQVLPALHLREAGRGMSETSSILNGAKLSDSTDPATVTRLFKEGLFKAATHYKASAKDIGGIDILPGGNSLDATKQAFLIYNRSSKALNQDPDASPYVMNYLDSAHINMVWPAGDPVALYFGNNHRDGNPGALTTYIHYGGAITD